MRSLPTSTKWPVAPEAAGRLPPLSTAAQRASLGMIAEACVAFGGPPEGLSCQGAFRELLARRGYDGEPTTLAPLKVDSLSLPAAEFTPVDLVAAGGD